MAVRDVEAARAPRVSGPSRFMGRVDQVVNTRTGEIFEVVATPRAGWWLTRVESVDEVDGSEGGMALRSLDDGTTFVVHLRQP